MAKEERNIELELLREQMKNLQAQVQKPKSSEEAFQERLAKYESKVQEREELRQQIEKRRMEIWAQNPRMRQDEVLLIEAWERRIKQTEKSNPGFAQQLKAHMKIKIDEVNKDPNR